MTPLMQKALDLSLLTAGYWLVDLAIRQDGFLRILKRLRVTHLNAATAVWIVGSLALAPLWGWGGVPQSDVLRLLALLLVGMLTWNAVTKDIDLVNGKTHDGLRLLLIASAVGVYFHPACLLVAGFLLTTPFGLWEHHATLPMRVVQALMAYVCLATLLPPPMFGDATAILFFILTIQISHYLITALAKMLLGPKWYSWVTDNHLHHIAASAYSWGWARFLPWRTWRKVIGLTKIFEKPMQVGVFALELLAPLALLHPHAAIGFCLGWTAFHLGVFALSGLLFWDWMLTNLAVAYIITLLPASVTAQVFGPLSTLMALAFMALFPLRHKLWKPMPLGWFDSPFTQRIHWQVRGASGRLYGLYNNYMCPHERLYGKVHGCFLAPVPVITYHLGEVWKPELRDAIRAAGPDLNRLDAVRKRFGISPRSARMTADHAAYIRCFFRALNRGARKHWLPRALRWLKAPGGQIFYWGELPAFRGQEKVVEVSLHYREEYFDGQALQRLRNEQVLKIDVGDDLDPCEASAGVRELTPKEIDDFLLGYAAGRLIDLPGMKGGYVHADDGKQALEH